MKKLAVVSVIALFVIAVLAQTVGPGYVVYVTSAPSGNCSAGSQQQDVIGTGSIYTCQSGTWAQVSGGGGSSAFSALTGSTNTTAAMVVGSGASMSTSGTGTIAATSLTGTPALPNGTTATTQTTNDNSTKVATDAYVDTKNSTCSTSNTGPYACLISTTASGAASITLTGWRVAAYTNYDIIFKNIIGATNNTFPEITMGNGSCDTGTNYSWSLHYTQISNGPADTIAGDGPTANFIETWVVAGLSSSGLPGQNATFHFPDPGNTSNKKWIYGQSADTNTGGGTFGAIHYGFWNSTAAVTHLCVQMSSGNISGTVYIIGVAP